MAETRAVRWAENWVGSKADAKVALKVVDLAAMKVASSAVKKAAHLVGQLVQ